MKVCNSFVTTVCFIKKNKVEHFVNDSTRV